MKKTRIAALLLLFVIVSFSCSKNAGEGGNSSIYGKIITYNYNAEFTHLKGIYPAADEDVFIIYGGDRSFSDRIRTNYDGVYEFKFLRPGDYTVYAYSKDSTLTLPSGMYPVIRTVTIDKNKQSVQVPDMKIFR